MPRDTLSGVNTFLLGQILVHFATKNLPLNIHVAQTSNRLLTIILRGGIIYL